LLLNADLATLAVKVKEPPPSVGFAEGCDEGEVLGCAEGDELGCAEGDELGCEDGICDGEELG